MPTRWSARMNGTLDTIDNHHISINAIKVVNRLTEHGYQAYVVGGCVRDLLLGKTPKDFDVATDAHPEEVRDLFRNSRIIGKRFRIVHVRFGREIVEVTTFRAPHDDQYDENHSDSGRTLVDNVFGNFEEDVFRRDFTMNAVYHQPETGEIIDLANGVDDIRQRIIRPIGDAEDRFREDPVRMLRAIRFQAKLDFSIEPHTEKTIRSLGYLIQVIPPARLFEEMLKLFMSGYGSAAFSALLEHEIFGWLFPDANRSMKDYPAQGLITAALDSTDRRIAEGKPVTPAFVFAALLWYPFVEERDRLQNEENMTQVQASQEAANNVLAKQQLFTSIPRRFTGPLRDIWFLQFRLPMRFGQKPDILLEHKRFRAAYDFLILRETAGEELEQLGEWWTEYQEASAERRNEMKQSSGPKRRKRRNRKRRPRTETGDQASWQST
ncbi:MAG: polynucleotide adenylyltransferase PcnB [Proteobacteria bacterium]|nr:polynucleotide adenylyltransferase PcnB [Pseudomonadota bacterium]